jgi:hypothetical protein
MGGTAVHVARATDSEERCLDGSQILTQQGSELA